MLFLIFKKCSVAQNLDDKIELKNFNTTNKIIFKSTHLDEYYSLKWTSSNIEIPGAHYTGEIISNYD